MSLVPGRESTRGRWGSPGLRAWPLIVVFLVALVLRGGWGVRQLARSDGAVGLEFPDERQYWLMAENLRRGEGLKDEFGFRATRMPLYPAMLSLFVDLPRGMEVAKGFQWLIGAVGAVLTAGLATALFGSRVGLVAGLLVAWDPFLVFFSSLLLTETMFVAALSALWWCVTVVGARANRGEAKGWGCWVVMGVLGSLCVYVRESSVGLVACVLAGAAAVCRFRGGAVGGAMLAGLLVVAALVPWALRNEHVTGQRTWLTHRGGISLYDGVGPQADGSSNLGAVQQMEAVRGLKEVEWDRYFREASWRAMREDPGRVVRLAGVKLARTWNPLPNVEAYQSSLVRGVSLLWTLPVYLLAVGGAVLVMGRGGGGRWRAVLLLLPAGYFSVVHSLFVGSVRYRVVAMPMLEILAACAVVFLVDRWARGGRSRMAVQ